MAENVAELPIESGIPIPNSRHAGAGRVLTLLRRMSVGDSVVIPLAQSRGFLAQMYRFTKTGQTLSGWKFVSRSASGQVRVWRVK